MAGWFSDWASGRTTMKISGVRTGRWEEDVEREGRGGTMARSSLGVRRWGTSLLRAMSEWEQPRSVSYLENRI